LEINFFDTANEFFSSYKTYIFWLGVVSLLIFIFSLISIRWLVTLIPSDYFTNKGTSEFKKRYPLTWLFSIVIKNIIGYALILGGLLMLVLPGQGLFTIFIGLILSNYPGKYKLERKLISIPSIFKMVNWLRDKSNKPPLDI
jgi:hypothetical protein|tara:strand:- start:1202 stop:1627 length:426 start_codon:yes stop_codon:yes gene_type:complete